MRVHEADCPHTSDSEISVAGRPSENFGKLILAPATCRSTSTARSTTRKPLRFPFSFHQQEVARQGKSNTHLVRLTSDADFSHRSSGRERPSRHSLLQVVF